MHSHTAFGEKYKGSGKLYEQAQRLLPSGISHDVRDLDPYPAYVVRAKGSRKWDVDGNEIIDYVMGHGALMLGHGHPAVVEAVRNQMALGTHYGTSHPLELEWGNWIQRLVPSAERVKFTSSGTEATQLALRMARAFTGREKVIRFRHNFHGWHDYVVVGFRAPFDVPVSTGVPKGVQESMVTLPQGDLALVEEALQQGDIAGVILEPGGGFQGKVPSPPGWEAGLRQLTTRYGALLIFDEVVTGFRAAPGGMQQLLGITPDLTALAKIVAGGLPGGVLAGRAEVMALLELRDVRWNRYERVSHPGTFNGNPLSAAAAIAVLSRLADGEVHRATERMASQLRTEMTAVLRRNGVAGCVYGQNGMFHLMVGADPAPGQEIWELDTERLFTGPGAAGKALRRALLFHGVDLLGSTGMLSSAHTADDLEQTVDAFDQAVRSLQGAGVLPV
jgi:glutamate-1-semialdehyde 2,1-aminomutase